MKPADHASCTFQVFDRGILPASSAYGHSSILTGGLRPCGAPGDFIKPGVYLCPEHAAFYRANSMKNPSRPSASRPRRAKKPAVCPHCGKPIP